MIFNRQFFIFAGVILIIVIIFIVGLFAQNRNPEQVDTPSKDDVPASQSGAAPEVDHSDHIEYDMFVDNFDDIDANFPEDQSIFINNRIRDYATTHHPEALPTLRVLSGSFTQRSSNSYGFTITSEENINLFYVIAERLPDNSVKVNFYKS